MAAPYVSDMQPKPADPNTAGPQQNSDASAKYQAEQPLGYGMPTGQTPVQSNAGPRPQRVHSQPVQYPTSGARQPQGAYIVSLPPGQFHDQQQAIYNPNISPPGQTYQPGPGAVVMSQQPGIYGPTQQPVGDVTPTGFLALGES